MESVALEIKIWILGGVVSILIVLLGILYSIIKHSIKTFINVTLPTILKKIDDLIKEVQQLNTNNVIYEKDIKEIKETIRELKEKHEKCSNFKPNRR